MDNSQNTKLIQRSVGVQVYDQIWERIVNGELKPGEKISDLRLSEDLGVSRTPVREALYLLTQDGIVKSVNNHGFYVATFSNKDVTEIYDIRTVLEVLALRLALPNLTNREIELTQKAMDEVGQLMQTGDETFSEKFLVVDRQFHQLLTLAAGNSRLATMMASLRGQIGVFQVYGIHSRPLIKLSFEHHQAIISALKQRDMEQATQAMERHIQEVKAHVLEGFTNA